MAHLVGYAVSEDDVFKKQVGRFLRSSPVPVSAVEERAMPEGATADVIVVDLRGDVGTAMAAIERLRAGSPAAGIFGVAGAADSDLILQAMRAGANEFLVWPPTDESFHGALERTAARAGAVQGTRLTATSLLFFGTKGGAGTTTIAVNCGVELARLSKRSTIILDLKPGLGEVALFLGMRPHYSVLDAIDNLHRIDQAFLRQLVVKHKSGVEVLAGSDQFDRPGVADGSSLEELLRLLTRRYEYLVIDAGSQVNPFTAAALSAANRTFLVANPDVPSIRNAQRLLDRIRKLGARGERLRLLLIRANEPYPIPLKEIEGAIGLPISHMFESDYRTVSTALNSGVPLALSGGSHIAEQFDHFTRGELNTNQNAGATPLGGKKVRHVLHRMASIW